MKGGCLIVLCLDYIKPSGQQEALSGPLPVAAHSLIQTETQAPISKTARKKECHEALLSPAPCRRHCSTSDWFLLPAGGKGREGRGSPASLHTDAQLPLNPSGILSPARAC